MTCISRNEAIARAGKVLFRDPDWTGVMTHAEWLRSKDYERNKDGIPDELRRDYALAYERARLLDAQNGEVIRWLDQHGFGIGLRASIDLEELDAALAEHGPHFIPGSVKASWMKTRELLQGDASDDPQPSAAMDLKSSAAGEANGSAALEPAPPARDDPVEQASEPAAPPSAPSVKKGRRGALPKYTYDQIRAHAFRQFKEKGLPDPDGEEGWRSFTDLEGDIENLCDRRFGKRPVKSTLQRYRARVIDDWKKRQADKGR